jgi:hypothetical protein
MSQPDLSRATRALLRAAREEAPGADTRAKVWSTVANTLGGAAGAGAAGAAGRASAPPGVLVPGATSASKMLALGTLLGGAVTVGLATLLLRIHPAPENGAPSSAAAALFAGPGAKIPWTNPEPLLATALAQAPEPSGAPFLASSTTAPDFVVFWPLRVPLAPAPWATPAAPVRRSVKVHPAADTLAREASLVARAHAALVGGDAHAALLTVRAARALPSHALRPEELSIEAQALRALGRDAQASEVDSTLKKQFPESALAPR